MERQGKLIMLIGALMILAGLILWLAGDRLRFLGHLPGDIRYERGNTRVYIPITTMLLLSLLLSAIMWIVQRLK
ncbi:MAG: DUF2905 domain-containing protein [Taibaiella sp.]|nr:DUF2905 domain-containing protein [Taibaiella sp.]